MMKINNILIREDCIYFRGDLPCAPHKQRGMHCKCSEYVKRGKRVLIIKLGAIGDVIRTTPLLRKLVEVYPDCEVSWLTLSPEVLPKSLDGLVIRPLVFNLQTALILQADEFDILYSLDKDREACALANLIKAKVKKGFVLKSGRCAPVDKDAEHKYLTGLFDDVNKANKKSYVEEIFEVCGLPYSRERYLFDKPKEKIDLSLKLKRPVIGLNTGCGSRWTTRLWPKERWVALSKMLLKDGYGVLLLGGEQEDAVNREIAKKSGAAYPGYFPMDKFVAIMDRCDLVVTAVTMGMHIAIGLEKKMVLFNNIFNRNEFELYGLGEIIEPDVECLGCFRQSCDKDCMKKITVKETFDACKRLLG